MPDQHTEVTHTGFFSNLFNSFIGALLGVLLFFASFVVLWINEGTVNLATIARQSTPVTAASVDPAMEGKLIAATGKLATTEALGDASLLRAQRYLRLERSVEMYAWVEHTRSSTTKNVGGSSTTETTYSYEKEWTSDPERSSSFRYPGGHENPELEFESQSWTASSATIGAYSVNPRELELPEATAVALDEENTEASASWLVRNNYLVSSASALTQPKIGDVRIRYAAVPNNTDVTLFGKASGAQIVPYEAKGTSLYRAFTENREQAIETLDTEYHLWIWIVRAIGFMMMWIGLMLCFSPVNTVLNILPFLGSASSFLTGLIMFCIALPLSIVTIVASIIAHNIFLLIGLLLLLLGGIVLWSRIRRPRLAAQPASI
ncbi:MAG TPA: TMEM43 family protein [Herpetosiphonaceae bacterium]